MTIFCGSILMFPDLAFGKEYVVGDEKGWRTGVDYAAWAAGKEFFVGDKLVFIYTTPNHDVYKVGNPNFETCTVPEGTTPMITGADVLTLTSPGKKWYMCGQDGHCSAGQKLAITVQSQGPVPSPIPGAPDNSSASGLSSYCVTVVLLHVVVILLVAMRPFT
ncbi:hypothetical protein J5N97_016104 [Dioscorea zingiberensis]|uniref:Phytocyanin domain-containing protein n=1 Tax=Dioscorea zingiberensis TaxID=325984 RepID=A0A9D5CJP2_9LILI|nr:hypothetical protein J5N97_016104 [Dioscorea zingiberensis]